MHSRFKRPVRGPHRTSRVGACRGHDLHCHADIDPDTMVVRPSVRPIEGSTIAWRHCSALLQATIVERVTSRPLLVDSLQPMRTAIAPHKACIHWRISKWYPIVYTQFSWTYIYTHEYCLCIMIELNILYTISVSCWYIYDLSNGSNNYSSQNALYIVQRYG